MKNSFLRLVSVALLSAAAGMAFAANPKFIIPGGANQYNIGKGKQLKGHTRPSDRSFILQSGKLDGDYVSCAPTTVDLEDTVTKNHTKKTTGICRTYTLNGVDGSKNNEGFESIDAAVLAAAQRVQNNQCQITRDKDPNEESDTGVGVEININGYERGGRYYYGDARWFSDNSLAAKSAPSESGNFSTKGLNHVFSFHNHPNTKDTITYFSKTSYSKTHYRSDMFSLDDLNAAKNANVPSFMMTCFLEGGSTTPRMLRLDPKTGNVHERHVSISKEGKLAYEGDWSKTPIYNFNGVLGWCGCANAKSCGSSCFMGGGWISIEESEKCCEVLSRICGRRWYVGDDYKRAHGQLVNENDGPGIVYLLCLKCGKIIKQFCVKPDEFSNHIGKMAKTDKDGDVHSLENLNIQSPELCRASDGEVIVKGVCKCSSPCLVRANFWTYVCSACGRLIPDPPKNEGKK